jgi:hypothetical protein
VHFQSQSNNGKKWVDFVDFKFHLDENIEWHCMQP